MPPYHKCKSERAGLPAPGGPIRLIGDTGAEEMITNKAAEERFVRRRLPTADIIRDMSIRVLKKGESHT